MYFQRTFLVFTYSPEQLQFHTPVDDQNTNIIRTHIIVIVLKRIVFIFHNAIL